MKHESDRALLTRDKFRDAVFRRDGNICVLCRAAGRSVPAQDAHHIIERRLWGDTGGYYLANGASVCGPCHLACEATTVGCDEVRAAAGITRVLLPPHLYDGERYDKWGNVILSDGKRLRGELFDDASVQRVIAPVLDQFTRHVKPPRTWHLPWSPQAMPDDRVMTGVDSLESREVVVTLKLDGENTTIEGPDGHIHARRVEPLAPDPSRDRVKAIATEIGASLQPNWRVTGENIAGVHTIRYQYLRPHTRWFFQVFNIWNERNVCLSWDDVCEWSALLDLPTVPVLWRGVWNERAIRALASPTFENDTMEGYVVRLADGFPLRDYHRAVGKCVLIRPDTHDWRHTQRTFNVPRARHERGALCP